LRAVAVLSVIGYHAAPGVFPGGFIGVDVFFAISGFLITTLILREQDRGHFCLGGFYLRRARRILPALLVVLAGIVAIGWWFLLPYEFQALRQGLIRSLPDFLRFMFGHDGGYFYGAPEEEPLVHLWSLAVEAQFYLAWPLTLVVLPARRQQLVALLLVLCASFAAGLVMADDSQIRAYYLPQFRFWQLALGGLLALAAHNKDWARPLQRFLGKWKAKASDIAAGCGLGLIAFAALGFSDRLAYPGWWALVPTLGAALVIGAGGDAFANRRLLASRPLVSIGLISYALYLWHWPLLSFRNILDLDADAGATVLCLATAVALAGMTYRFIEQPLKAFPLPERFAPRPQTSRVTVKYPRRSRR
jgi:peptidoglycan/LPS O-acetylase OafA/YrhL